jgi:hypothetical protein
MNAMPSSPRNETPASDELASRAQALLNAHPQFAGRTRCFQFVVRDDVLVVRGSVPTFYLKQILQNALKELEGIRQIDNQVVVTSSHGLNGGN